MSGWPRPELSFTAVAWGGYTHSWEPLSITKYCPSGSWGSSLFPHVFPRICCTTFQMFYTCEAVCSSSIRIEKNILNQFRFCSDLSCEWCEAVRVKNRLTFALHYPEYYIAFLPKASRYCLIKPGPAVLHTIKPKINYFLPQHNTCLCT